MRLETATVDGKVALLGRLESSHISKILVPFDGSDCSNNALEFAVNLALKYDSEICLFHVIPTSVLNYRLMTVEGSFVPACTMRESFVPVCTMGEMENEGEHLLLSALASVEEVGVQVSAQIDYGRPANKIVQIAKDENIDLIVMGSNGRGTITRLLFGSVCDEVVHKAQCPTLVVKKDEEESKNERDDLPYES